MNEASSSARNGVLVLVGVLCLGFAAQRFFEFGQAALRVARITDRGHVVEARIERTVFARSVVDPRDEDADDTVFAVVLTPTGPMSEAVAAIWNRAAQALDFPRRTSFLPELAGSLVERLPRAEWERFEDGQFVTVQFTDDDARIRRPLFVRTGALVWAGAIAGLGCIAWILVIADVARRRALAHVQHGTDSRAETPTRG